MNLNLILKNTAEELFWLGFALVLAWYSAVTWPLSGSLPIWKFTLLYYPFTISLVFMVKEIFFRYNRLFQLIILSISLTLSLVSVFILYIEYTRQFFRDQIPPLSEAIKSNDLMDIWALSAKQPDAQPYFLITAAFLALLLAISALRTGFILPRSR